MKNISYSLTLLLFSLLTVALGSCRKESTQYPSPEEEGSYMVTFTTGTSAARAAEEVTVASDDAENRIDEVLLVAFEDGKQVSATSAKKGTDGLYTAEVAKEGILDLLIVANADQALRTKLSDPDLELKAARSLLVETALSPETPLVMVNSTPLEAYIERGATYDLGNVSLARLASRFDLYNRVHDLDITSVSIAGVAPATGLLAPTVVADDLPRSSAKATPTAGGPSAKPVAVFYGYEDPMIEAVTLTIEATLKGKPIDPITVTLKDREVKRNTIYSLILNTERVIGEPVDEANPILSLIKVGLVTHSWSSGGTLSLPSDDELQFSTPDFTVASDLLTETPGQNPTALTLTTGSPAELIFTTTVDKDRVNVTAPDHPGVKIEEIGDKLAGETVTQTFKVLVPKNKSEDAEATYTLRVFNAYDPTLVREVTITQPASLPVPGLALARFADYNLDHTGKAFATGHAQDESGYFSYDQVTGRAALADGSTIALPAGYRLPTPWELAVIIPSSSDLKAAGMEDSTKGAIKFGFGKEKLSENVSELVDTDGKSPMRYSAEYKGMGNVLKEPGNYSAGSYRLVLGLRMKPHTGDLAKNDPPLPGGAVAPAATDYSNFTAYRYVLDNNPNEAPGRFGPYALIVTCRYLGEELKETTMADLEKPEFWTDNTGTYHTIVLPLIGYNGSQDGTQGVRGRGMTGRYISAYDAAYNTSFKAVYTLDLASLSIGNRMVTAGVQKSTPIRLIKE